MNTLGTEKHKDENTIIQKDRKTKIVVTIGPSTKSERSIRALVDEGMDIARFNFSHGCYEEYARWVKIVRKHARRASRKIEILGDLQGPRLRIGNLPKAGRHLISGRKVVLQFVEEGAKSSARNVVPITGCGNECSSLKKGDAIMLDNGNIELSVIDTNENGVSCRVENGGHIISNKGVNIPSLTIADSFTDKDEKDLDFILEQKLDYIGVSFVSSEVDIDRIKEKVGGRARLVAKIERIQAIKDFDDILKSTDAVMVARGDLGIEVPIQKVPLLQKRIIRHCNQSKKFVITATQMLASMAYQPRPTRAEVSDVANAVLDGTDAVMLSDETAMGKYPIETVRMMRKIVEETEEFAKTQELKALL